MIEPKGGNPVWKKEPLTVTSSPHLHGGMDTLNIMLDVIIALLPAAAASVWAVRLAGGGGNRGVRRLLRGVGIPQPHRDEAAPDGGRSVCCDHGAAAGLQPARHHSLLAGGPGGVAAIVVAKQMFGGLGYNSSIPLSSAVSSSWPASPAR